MTNVITWKRSQRVKQASCKGHRIPLLNTQVGNPIQAVWPGDSCDLGGYESGDMKLRNKRGISATCTNS